MQNNLKLDSFWRGCLYRQRMGKKKLSPFWGINERTGKATNVFDAPCILFLRRLGRPPLSSPRTPAQWNTTSMSTLDQYWQLFFAYSISMASNSCQMRSPWRRQSDNPSSLIITNPHLDKDCLTGLRLLLHPLHRLIGGDIDTEFLQIKISWCDKWFFVLSWQNCKPPDQIPWQWWQRSPYCGDPRFPRWIPTAIHTELDQHLHSSWLVGHHGHHGEYGHYGEKGGSA